MPKVSAAHLQARRRQILDAAIECFSREGFHCTTMQDIVQEARLSPGAIYRYFSSKEDIITAIADERHRQETELLEATLDGADPRGAFRELARAYFRWLTDPAEQKRRRLGVQIWAEALRNERVHDIIRRGVEQRLIAARFISHAQQQGQISSAIDPDAASRVMLAVLQGFVLQQAWDPTVDVESYLQEAERLIEAALPTTMSPS